MLKYGLRFSDHLIYFYPLNSEIAQSVVAYMDGLNAEISYISRHFALEKICFFKPSHWYHRYHRCFNYKSMAFAS